MSASFSTFSSFSIANLNPSSIGGGLAFVISLDDEFLGDADGYLRLIDTMGIGVVAVEFDTLMDVEFKDINGNHVGLDLSSTISSEVADLETIGVKLKSDDQINSWIEYFGSTRVFNVSISYSNLKPKEPLLSFNLDLALYVEDFMFVGFSGPTQGSAEIHNIEWWSFSSSLDANSKPGSPSTMTPPPTASLMNPTVDSVSPAPLSLALSESNDITMQTSEKDSKCHKLFKQGPRAMAGVVTAGAFFLALFVVVLVWVHSKKFKNVKSSKTLGLEIIKMPKEFSYKELKLATKCFNSMRIIGHVAFRTVCKGILPEIGSWSK